MKQIVRALEGDVSLDDLSSDGVKPGQSTVFGGSSVEYDAAAYSADMKKFRKLALESGIASSDYSLNPSASSASSGEHSDYGAK